MQHKFLNTCFNIQYDFYYFFYWSVLFQKSEDTFEEKANVDRKTLGLQVT